MYDFLHRTISAKAYLLCRDPAAKEAFLKSDCSVKVAVGETFKQPLLAKTLSTLFQSTGSLTSFYTGTMAEVVAKASRDAKNPVTGKAGLLQTTDMKGYKAVYRRPVHFSYRAPDGALYTIHGASMPFSGPVTMNLILKQLERIENGQRRASYGRFMDVQNGAFADRNHYLADADFVDVPISTLLSQGFAAQRFRALFPPGVNTTDGNAMPTPLAPGTVQRRHAWQQSDTPDHGTSHMSIADTKGNIVSMTTTVNGLMGSKVVVPGYGMLLNNQLCDFDAVGIKGGKQTVNAAEGGKKPRRTALNGDATSVGGKRPRSSMTPVIVEPVASGGQRIAAFGAPGGTDIIGGVTNVVRNMCGSSFVPLSLQAQTDAPRVIGKNQANISGFSR